MSSSVTFNPVFQRILAVGLLLGLAACATKEPTAPGSANVGLNEKDVWAAQGWQPFALPAKRKTQYKSVDFRGRSAQHAVANGSASMLRRKLHVAAPDLGTLQFSWLVPALIGYANMAERATDDAVVRVILSFDGDRQRLSSRYRALSELSLALTGEELPYATLMYVWCNACPVGDVITNPRTDRIRKLVVESGSAHLDKWLDYERHIRSDFIKAFGEEPGALVGIAIMTDTDNTQSQAAAWYGPISFTPATAPAAATAAAASAASATVAVSTTPTTSSTPTTSTTSAASAASPAR